MHRSHQTAVDPTLLAEDKSHELLSPWAGLDSVLESIFECKDAAASTTAQSRGVLLCFNGSQFTPV